MKRSLSKALSVMLALVVAIGITGSFTFKAAAADYNIFLDETLYVGVETDFGASENVKDRILSVTSSNNKVATIERVTGSKKSNIFSYTVVPKKTGKATIKVTYKTKSGAKKYKKFKCTVKPYPNMVKSLKVNGKTVTVNKKSNSIKYTKEGIKKTSVKMALTPASGWKIDSAYGFVYKFKPWDDDSVKITKKMVKGKTAIAFPKKYDYLAVTVRLVNDKGVTIGYDIDFRR